MPRPRLWTMLAMRVDGHVVDKPCDDAGGLGEGIGRALYEAAVVEITKRKAVRIEVMSEIAVRNANGFYRALGVEQASYRFVAAT